MKPAATFVMPIYCDQPDALRHAVESVRSIVAQTDPQWCLVIVDDCSPQPREQRRAQLETLRELDPARIVVIENEPNRGQGYCRNVGIEWAHRAGSPIVLFQDADDIAHPRRLEVTRAVFDSGQGDFVYSRFQVIDEYGNRPDPADITPSIAEILAALDRAPAVGRDCWITLAADTGYLTLTSTVAVSTELGMRHPFPECRGSEDTHTFLRMSGGGAVFSYQPEIPTQYRVRRAGGSADRARIGREKYYATRVRIDREGFDEASRLALARGTVTPAEVTDIRRRFLARLAETIRAEGMEHLLEGLV